MTDEEIAARKSIAKKLNEEIEAAGVKAADEGGDPVIKMMEVLCRHIIDVEARLNCLEQTNRLAGIHE